MRRILTLYQNSYRGLNPASWWLSAVMLINRSGTMVVPFMTLYLTQKLHYSISQAGLVFGIFGAGAICGGLIGGRLADLFGFYPVQVVALGLGGILFMILGHMHTYPLICLFTFLLALINDSFRPANAMAIAQYSSIENRTRSYSLNRLAINLGWASGGSLGGFIAAHNYNLLFIIDGWTNIGAAILLLLFLPPAKGQRIHRRKLSGVIRFEAYRDIRYLWFIVLVILYALVFFQLFSTLPVYFRQVLHLSEPVIGGTMAGNGIIIALFEMVLVFRLEGRNSPLQYIPIGSLICAISFMIYNLFPAGILVAAISTILVTVGEMLSMPFMNTYWTSRTQERNRGQYAGLYTVAWSLAQVLGPISGARFADKLGFTALWWLIGGIGTLVSFGFWLLHRDEKALAISARTE